MWLQAAESGQEVGVTMHLGDPADPTPFEAWFEAPPGSIGQWALVELAWEDFIKPDWFGEGGLTQFDASRVVGLSFDFGAPEGSRNEGELWVDDIALSAEAPVVAPSPIAPAEEGEEEEPVAPILPSEEAEEGIGALCSGICPFSALSLPLVALGVIWRRRRNGEVAA